MPRLRAQLDRLKTPSRGAQSFARRENLTGMLVSSVTLGLLSDRLGRLRCIHFGYSLALLANLAAIFAPNYFLLNICIFLMSYAQVGAANALCTLRK